MNPSNTAFKPSQGTDFSSMNADINRSEGEGMATNTGSVSHINSQSEKFQRRLSSSEANEVKWSEALKDEAKFSGKMIATAEKLESKLNQTEQKLGISKKFQEVDQKYGITDKMDSIADKAGYAAVHFGRALSRGQFSQAFRHSFDAGRIAECERKKHDSKGLGPPAWIPESDKEGLVEGSVGKEPSWNELFQKESMEANRRDFEALRELNMGSTGANKV